LYYGLLLAQQFGGAHLTRHILDAPDVNLTAYTGVRNETGLIALFNKDLDCHVSLQVMLNSPVRHARIWRLQAPDISDTHHTRFAEAQVDANGNWAATSNETATLTAPDEISVFVPRASAVLVWLDS
jgi:hypothetical protein